MINQLFLRNDGSMIWYLFGQLDSIAGCFLLSACYWNVCVACDGMHLFSNVFADTGDVLNFHRSHHIFIRKFTNDGRFWIAALFMGQCVAFQCNDAFHVATVQCFFIEFFAQFECNFGCLECRRSDQFVLVAFFLQFNSGWHRITDFTENKADTCSNKIEEKKILFHAVWMKIEKYLIFCLEMKDDVFFMTKVEYKKEF